MQVKGNKVGKKRLAMMKALSNIMVNAGSNTLTDAEVKECVRVQLEAFYAKFKEPAFKAYFEKEWAKESGELLTDKTSTCSLHSAPQPVQIPACTRFSANELNCQPTTDGLIRQVLN